MKTKIFTMKKSGYSVWTIIGLFLLIICLYTCPVIAQDSGNAAANINKADKLLNGLIPEFDEALELYLKASKSAPEDNVLSYMIGLCYLNTNDKTKAVPYLEKAGKIEGNPELHYLLAKAYQLNYQLDKAKAEYELYKNALSQSELSKKYISRIIAKVIREEQNFQRSPKVKVTNIGDIIDRRIEECRQVKRFVKDPVDVVIENLGTNVNTTYPEYGPVITADESVMFFTSRREETTGGGKDPIDGRFFEDIYVTINVEGKWLPALSIEAPICTDLHESVIGLSADGQKLFIYKDESGDGGDLYVSNVHGYVWGPPERLPDGINSRFAEKSASLSADESMLFFVSDRPGGQGGRDIYMSKKKDRNTWYKPVNLGSKINTKYDEDGVFFHPDGKTLYFSSKGHQGLGGYDIFEATYDKGKWSEPKNLGYPINTNNDDIYFVLSANGERGYYASFRKDGEGEKDLYKITFPKPSKKLTLLTGVITDKITSGYVGADIQIIDNDSNKVIGELSSNAQTGKYLISLPSGRNYGINVSKEGYLFHSENFDIPALKEYQEIEKNIALKKIRVGAKIVLNNIFFDYDKATLRPTSIAELERLHELLIHYSRLKIEISGHTDNKGGTESNQRLSEKRAQAVVDHLVEQGIEKQRLKAVGYGETKSIAPNENPDGSDNPEGRQMNRRTEFEVVED